ncbi:hypothetical protein FOA43_004592 [Brettanomyces nanus]|uniref:Enoyl reductase (ER) domain-containing protein n=1 Tax=Eeniella nana TaxID=13502 RepID=A0A875SAX0_EENNA|nr:uncharacterized protein FOA43_004592 [Brettanomyces nanus]QPG77185.1 hypothetical protein FOA43_004592 [Brettanomyces nanus]
MSTAATASLPKVVDGKIQSLAITYTTGKSPLKVQTIEFPVASADKLVKPTDVLVKTKASTINPVDCILRSLAPSWYKGSVVKVLGGDFSGVVVDAGSESGSKVGDRVYENMSFNQAASLPVVGGTGYQILKSHDVDSLKGSHVLILGGGTSVGNYSIQFAKHYFGAKTIVATCSSRSFERVRKFGADTLVDYTKGKTHELNGILESVKTNGKFDIVVDCVRDPIIYGSLDTVLKYSKEGGVYAQVSGSKKMNYKGVSILDLIPQWFFFFETLKEKLGLSNFKFVGFMEGSDPKFTSAVEQLWKKSKLIVDIDSTHDWKTDYEAAFDKVALCKAKGKVILEFD